MKTVRSIILVFIFAGNCFAQFQLDTAKLAMFGDGKLSDAQIKKADSLLIYAVDHYNSTDVSDSIVLSRGDGEHIHLSDYYRQYQFRSDQNGNCFIRASCFCSSVVSNLNKVSKENRIDWKKYPLKVSDGGSCIFTINLDLKSNKASMMRVNGM